jgi:glycosyltransferase involved in cell wall biosynthesis
MVSPYSPYPAVHGGAVRMLALIRRLAPAVDVTLVSYGDTAAELAPRSIDELNKVCREAHVLERPGHTLGGMLEPAKTRGFWSESMSGMIEYLLDRDDYDVAQVEYTHMAHLMPPAAPGLVRALVEHDVSFVSIARSRATARGLLARVGLWFEWMRMLRYEVAAVEHADLVLTMSDTDRAVLGRFVDTRHVVTIPNGVDCGRFPFATDSREPDTVLFVGFFRHQPNVEAVCFFCREVLPLVRRDVPTVRFRVVGAYPTEAVRRLADEPGVEVTGLVDDIAAYYRASAVFVAPVLQGSGTRLKILEAMASGCAVVSTSIGAEGLGATDGVEFVLADTPDAMARAIVALLADPERRATLARRAREFVIARYDWDAIATRLIDAYRAALEGRPHA